MRTTKTENCSQGRCNKTATSIHQVEKQKERRKDKRCVTGHLKDRFRVGRHQHLPEIILSDNHTVVNSDFTLENLPVVSERNGDLDEAAGAADATACSRSAVVEG
jgi:hypothetical protein